MNIHNLGGVAGTGRQRYSSLNNSPSATDHEDHMVKICNPNINGMDEDVFYHFALGTKSHDIKAMFGDVKFVCIGGSPRRMEQFAYFLVNELDIKMPAGQSLVNIARESDRYALYKVGPVLSVSHGIGIPSLSVVLHELLKILFYAKVDDVRFFRLGTSGGIGLDPGTVVVSESTVDALLRPTMDLAILGKLVSRPAVLDAELADELVSMGREEDAFKTTKGTTMCTLDFYEGQGRLDGAFCDYTPEDKMKYLHDIYEKGVRNIEMESLCFAAMCHKANVKCAVICVTIVDRLRGDQLTATREMFKQWDHYPAVIVSRLIKKRMAQNGLAEQAVL